MSRRILVLVGALATVAATFGAGAQAAGRDPLVVQGIGPGSAEDPFARPAHSRDQRQPRLTVRAQRRIVSRGVRRQSLGRAAIPATARLARQLHQRRGQFGGGFIEFLVTGNSGPPMQAQPAPDDGRRAYYPQRQQQAALAPVPHFRRGLSSVVDPKYRRQEVAYSGKHKPGTLIVDTPNRFLYLVQPNGRALRYGIGVGRPGFEWSGIKRISRKALWPDWRPPTAMLKRRPDLPTFMPGGPGNPLGARALYLGSSLYRIHGTNEPETIGTNVSSGCIRLLNEDVKDLYNRVSVGAKAVVI